MNITLPRAVIEQALEALDYVMRHGPAVQKAKDLLQNALEQPEQEPVAWMDREGDVYKMPEIEGWAPPHTMLYTSGDAK